MQWAMQTAEGQLVSIMTTAVLLTAAITCAVEYA